MKQPLEPLRELHLLSTTRTFYSRCGERVERRPGPPDPELFDPLREERIRSESSAERELRSREIALDPLTALLLGENVLVRRTL